MLGPHAHQSRAARRFRGHIGGQSNKGTRVKFTSLAAFPPLMRYLSCKQIHRRRADKLRDEDIGGAVEEFERGSDLLDMPLRITTMRSAMVMASTWSWVT